MNTKQGAHGTLFLYEIGYSSFDSPLFKTRVWAYNEEHAEELFFANSQEDDDWDISFIQKVK